MADEPRNIPVPPQHPGVANNVGVAIAGIPGRLIGGKAIRVDTAGLGMSFSINLDISKLTIDNSGNAPQMWLAMWREGTAPSDVYRVPLTVLTDDLNAEIAQINARLDAIDLELDGIDTAIDAITTTLTGKLDTTVFDAAMVAIDNELDGKVDNNPQNGTIYSRLNGSWVADPVQNNPPNDTIRYGRLGGGGGSGSWSAEAVQSNPPNDGVQYARTGAAGGLGVWTPIAGTVPLRARFDATQHILNINPWMEHDQENNGASVTVNGDHPTDQHNVQFQGIMTVNASRIALPFGGNPATEFRPVTNAQRCIIGTADAALAPGDFFAPFNENIEGYRVGQLAFGATNPGDVDIITITRVGLDATLSLAVRNGAANRSYVHNIAHVANIPTAYLTRVSGDVAGTWPKDNATGLQVSVCAGTGTSFQAGSLDAWLAGNFIGHAATTNVAGTAGAIVDVAAVLVMPAGLLGLNPGVIDNSLIEYLLNIRRSYDDELRQCKRYWQPHSLFIGGPKTAGTTTGIGCSFPVQMRATPSVSVLVSGNAAVDGAINRTVTDKKLITSFNAASTGSYIISEDYGLNARM